MSGIERFLKLTFERRRIAAVGGKYRGPKNQKGSGKAVGSKRGKGAASSARKPQQKSKQRLRDRKNIGKRRQPSAGEGPREAGHKPLKRQPAGDN